MVQTHTSLFLFCGMTSGFGKEMFKQMMKRRMIPYRDNHEIRTIIITRDAKQAERVIDEVCDGYVPSWLEPYMLEFNLEKSADIEKCQRRLAEVLRESLDEMRLVSFFVVMNAGSVAPCCNSDETIVDDFASIQAHTNLNVVSFNAILATFFKSIPLDVEAASDGTVLDVSSICAVQPVNGLGYYNGSKANRLMVMKTFAAGMSRKCPKVRFLSYSPGPMDTKLVREQILSSSSSFADWFRDAINTKKGRDLMTPEESALRCCYLLVDPKGKTSWKSGELVDVYEVTPPAEFRV